MAYRVYIYKNIFMNLNGLYHEMDLAFDDMYGYF